MRCIIHWGLPDDIELYIQESGRAERDGKMSYSTIYKKSSDLNLHSTSKEMVDYCKNNSQCRCHVLISNKDFRKKI